MAAKGADSLSLAAVCCVMSKERQTKQLHTALSGCFVLDFLARAIFFRGNRVGKVAQVSHSGGVVILHSTSGGMSDFNLRKDLLGRSDILTSQADSQS